MATLTQTLSDDAIQVLADEFDKEIEIVHAADEVDAEPEFEDADEDLEPTARRSSRSWATSTTARPRCWTRSARPRSAAGEAGGITQHIGAYQVHHGDKDDHLPRHAGPRGVHRHARPRRAGDRHRGDRGRRRRRREAADRARRSTTRKAAEVPMLVAVNKIDKEGAQPDRVRTEMTQLGLQPEEWGGDTMFVDVSAKTQPGPRRPARVDPAASPRSRSSRPTRTPRRPAS